MSPASHETEPRFEPCPTPQSWHQVAQEFHETATCRIFSTPHADVKVTEYGTGHPVVFLPAMSGTGKLFCLTAALLKEQYRSLIIERPTFRKFPSIRSLISKSAEALSLTLEHLCPAGADVYAPQFSSQMALQIMAARPCVIRSAVLQSAWAHRRFNLLEKTLLRAGQLCPFALKNVPVWKTMQIENHRRWFPPFDETRFGFLLQEAGETSVREFVSQLLAASRTDLSSQCEKITQPIMILHCEGEGGQVAASAESLEKRLPHACRMEMSHSGHFPYLTHSHRLVKILKPFWESVEARQRKGL